MISFDSDICGEFGAASSREWIETNGIGGYASSTIAGSNTRRYHGLLVAATRPPLGRVVLLSKFEETLVIDGERFEISCNQYPGTVQPEGYKFLTDFRLDPFPIWTYMVNAIEIEKSVFMIYGENSVVCQWKVKNKSEISNFRSEIELKPLLAFRDHHHLRHEDSNFGREYQVEETSVSITPYAEMPTLCLAHNASAIELQGNWYRDFEYAIERERGFDYHEDLFQPFSMRFDLSIDATVIASTEPKQIADAEALAQTEIERRKSLIKIADPGSEFEERLVLAADQFIVSRGIGKTVIAGYHWFSDWGRDTMIALNGLTLATNRPEIAKSVITEFSRYISQGMIPNRFPDAGETPDYNTVDATLWYFEAIRAFAEITGDYDFVRETLYEKLIDIINWHILGTRFYIHVEPDGLLYAGEPGVQLTWMDAKIGDQVITPRTGKPVEMQALWYNALCILADFAKRFGDAASQKKYLGFAENTKRSFNDQFWNEEGECLFDVIDGDKKDASVRPNQIFAVSLPHSMLSSETARKVVKKVEAELLTPYGLRSLSPNDPHYIGIYLGSPLARDSGYHQGTVWSWPIGHFVDAYRKAHSKDPKSDDYISEIIRGFEGHLSKAMVGQVSEIFDGDHPHHPRGCAAQAWSVAELLRVVPKRIQSS